MHGAGGVLPPPRASDTPLLSERSCALGRASDPSAAAPVVAAASEQEDDDQHDQQNFQHGLLLPAHRGVETSCARGRSSCARRRPTRATSGSDDCRADRRDHSSPGDLHLRFRPLAVSGIESGDGPAPIGHEYVGIVETAGNGHVGYVGVTHGDLPGDQLFFSHTHLHDGRAPGDQDAAPSVTDGGT